MKQYDTIFLDRDGTINPDPGYIRSLDQFEFYSYTLNALSNLSYAGNRFCIITNQSGVGRGIVHLEALAKIHNYILNSFHDNGIDLLGIYFCPSHPDEKSRYRKPEVGMFKQASKDHGINLARSIMIGDAVSDIEAGVNSNMDTMLLLSGRGEDSQKNLGEFSPTYIAKDLAEGAGQILGMSS